MKRTFSSILVVLALAGTAFADEPSDQVKQEAKLHYQKAEAAFQAGRYAEAASEYGIAFEVIQDPILFYKIGVAHQLDGKCPAAVVYFKRYIKEGKPKEDFLATVEDKIAECSGGGATKPQDPAIETDVGTTAPPDDTVAEAEPEAEPEAEAEAEAETGTEDGAGDLAQEGSEDTSGAPSFLDTKPSWKKSAAWVSVAATVGFGTVGAILLMSSRSRAEDLEALADFRDPQDLPAEYDGTVVDRYETLVEEGERFQTWSSIAFGAAGVAAVAAVSLFALDRSSNAESGSVITRITPVVGADQAGFAATFGF